MKRFVILSWCAILLSVAPVINIFSQESYSPRVMMGLVGGANMSNVIFIPNVQQAYKWGMDAGAVLRVDVESYAGIWLEASYSQRGWTEAPTEEGGYTYSRSLRYVSVPVLTHLMIGKSPLKLVVQAGPQFGYLLGESATTTYPSEGVKGVETHQHDIPVQNKMAWGLTGGLGAEYHLPHFVIGLKGGYYYGLGDLFHNTRQDYFGKTSEQVFSAKLYLLYSF